MDKLWIKAVLIIAFVISLGYVFVHASRTLQDPPQLERVTVASPTPPVLTEPPALPNDATAEQIESHLKQKERAVAIYKLAVESYVQNVNAYAKHVETTVAVAKANSRDTTARINAFEKVIKDTIGPLIVAPLLAALVIYSGIKVSGDVAIARVTKAAAQSEVKAP